MAANGGCTAFFIIGGGDTAIMCSTISAGVFPEHGYGFGLCILVDNQESVVKR